MRHYVGPAGFSCNADGDRLDASAEVTTDISKVTCAQCISRIVFGPALDEAEPRRVRPEEPKPTAPDCCRAGPDAEPAEILYAAYNDAGVRRGVNFAGDPCPLWKDLPPDVQTKWRAVVARAARLLLTA